jgi:hypothetical protein
MATNVPQQGIKAARTGLEAVGTSSYNAHILRM